MKKKESYNKHKDKRQKLNEFPPTTHLGVTIEETEEHKREINNRIEQAKNL